VTWCDRPPRSVEPRPPAEFAIVLLSTPSPIRTARAGTAICVPGAPRVRAVGALPPPRLPAHLGEFTLSRQRMAAFAAGCIVMEAPGVIEPGDVFPPDSDRPLLDRLAFALLEAADAEAAAPYTALIRRELHLPAGEDAAGALAGRLSPGDPRARPPARAPAVRRLRAAIRALQSGEVPSCSLETLAQDLRFLHLFTEEHAWPAAALDRLLADVLGDGEATGRLRQRRKRRGKVVPLRSAGRSGGRREDA
jgi:hypothetical protein